MRLDGLGIVHMSRAKATFYRPTVIMDLKMEPPITIPHTLMFRSMLHRMVVISFVCMFLLLVVGVVPSNLLPPLMSRPVGGLRSGTGKARVAFTWRSFDCAHNHRNHSIVS